MEELKKFLIDNGVLEIFCKAIVDTHTRSSKQCHSFNIHGCIDTLFNWSRAEDAFGTVSEDMWQELNSKLIGLHIPGTIGCSREELVRKLITPKKVVLHNLINRYKH